MIKLARFSSEKDNFDFFFFSDSQIHHNVGRRPDLKVEGAAMRNNQLLKSRFGIKFSNGCAESSILQILEYRYISIACFSLLELIFRMIHEFSELKSVIEINFWSQSQVTG